MSLGEAIVTLRRANGLTQQELADRAEITQAALSRYENELRSPDASAISTLAEALGVTAEFLQRADRADGAFMIEAHMRRRATARPTVWRQLEAKLNVYRQHLEAVAETVDLVPRLSLPTFDPMEYGPDEAARMVRMQWRMPAGPVRGLTRWLESAGCLIVIEDFGSAAGGSRVDGLSQWSSDAPVVLVNERAPTDRLRLTLAHELGHICLHSDELGGDPEDEANSFAAEFLMPAAAIRADLRNLDLGRLHLLKRQWGVSMQALIERAHHLGTLAPAKRTSLYKALSKRGWRTEEPLSDELPPEQPTLVHRLVDALSDAGLTRSETRHVIGITESADSPPPFAEHAFAPAARRLTVVDKNPQQRSTGSRDRDVCF